MNLFPGLNPLTRDVVELVIVIFILFWPAIIVWGVVQVMKHSKKRQK